MSLDLITVLIYWVGFFLSIAIFVVMASWNHKEEDGEIGDTIFGCIPFCLFWPLVFLFICLSVPFVLLSKFVKNKTRKNA